MPKKEETLCVRFETVIFWRNFHSFFQRGVWVFEIMPQHKLLNLTHHGTAIAAFIDAKPIPPAAFKWNCTLVYKSADSFSPADGAQEYSAINSIYKKESILYLNSNKETTKCRKCHNNSSSTLQILTWIRKKVIQPSWGYSFEKSKEQQERMSNAISIQFERYSCIVSNQESFVKMRATFFAPILPLIHDGMRGLFFTSFWHRGIVKCISRTRIIFCTHLL